MGLRFVASLSVAVVRSSLNLLEHVLSLAEWFPPQFTHFCMSLFGQSSSLWPGKEQLAQMSWGFGHLAAVWLY